LLREVPIDAGGDLTVKVCEETAMYFRWSLTPTPDVVRNGTALRLRDPPLQTL
jgi:hypothetical protein